MWISASNTWNKSTFGEGSKHYRQKCKFSKWFKNSLGQVKGQHNQNVCKPYHVGSLWCNCLKWGWSANHTHQEKTPNTGCLQARRCASWSQTPGPGLERKRWEQRVIGCELCLGKRLQREQQTGGFKIEKRRETTGVTKWRLVCKNHQHCHIQTWFRTRSETNLVTVLASMTIFGKYICLAGQGKLGWNWCHRKPLKCLADSLNCTANSQSTKTESWSVERVLPSQRNYIKQKHARLKFEIPRCLHPAGRSTKRRLRKSPGKHVKTWTYTRAWHDTPIPFRGVWVKNIILTWKWKSPQTRSSVKTWKFSLFCSTFLLLVGFAPIHPSRNQDSWPSPTQCL